ncbi:MAG TPA: zf-HC2 domain-containing protein [Acidobacteriota bacterium]|nr:zf-HC2 domain-containing protein [Acidobacteriota bacterium]
MDCKKAEKLLVEYLYQELSPRQTVDVERHLEVCDACSATLDNWRAIHRGYQKTMEEAPAVPYLSQRILAAAKEELQRKPSFYEKFIVILKPALILPVLIFALIATLMLYQKQDKQMAKSLTVSEKPASAPESSIRAKDREQKRDLDAALNKQEGERRSEVGRLDKEQDGEKFRSLDYVGSSEDKPTRAADEITESGADQKLKSAPREYYEQQSKEQPIAGEPQAEAPKQAETLKNEEYPVAQAGAQTPPPAAPSKNAGLKDDSFEAAQSNFRNNNLPEGLAVAKKVIENDKSGSEAVRFHQAGIQYQNSKEPEQAIVQFNLVLNNYPGYGNSPDVIRRLAESYEQIGDYDKALKAYEQLSRYPTMKATARQRIGEMQKRQKSRDQLRSLGYADTNQKE